jgi:hypothetical protein
MAPILFPTGRTIAWSEHQDWHAAANLVKTQDISMSVVKTPYLCAIARTVKFAAEYLGENLIAEMRRKEKEDAEKRRPKSRLTLGEAGGNPKIDETQMPRLTPTEYRVVSALVAAKSKGQPRLTAPELDAQSNTTDARKVLKSLAASHPLWKEIILFPARKGDGYGIA